MDFPLMAADDIRQMHGRRLVAPLTLHLLPSLGALSFFEPLDRVAQFGGFLVIFLGNRLLEAIPELDKLRLRLLVLGQTARHLAAVPDLAVDVFQQRQQILAKCLIVMRAAQSAGITELHELDAAMGTLMLSQKGLVSLPALGRATFGGTDFVVLRFVQILIGTL